MQKIKGCPLCGRQPTVGTAKNPDSFWDGCIRGEKYGYVMCYYCNLILKDYDRHSAIKAWNHRGDWGLKQDQKRLDAFIKEEPKPKPKAEPVTIDTLQSVLDRLDTIGTMLLDTERMGA